MTGKLGHRVRVPGIAPEMLAIGIHHCDFCGKPKLPSAEINAGQVNGATLCAPCLRWLAETVEENEEETWAAYARYCKAAEERRKQDNAHLDEVHEKVRVR